LESSYKLQAASYKLKNENLAVPGLLVIAIVILIGIFWRL